MEFNAIKMEDHFNPGFKTKPSVFQGSQTIPLFLGNIKEQAWEGCSLAAAGKGDIAIVRNFDPIYLKYWSDLMDNPYVINIIDQKTAGQHLTKVILEDQNVINSIKEHILPNFRLMVFMPTDTEQQLATKLGIPLHGSPKINELYGTKSGIRRLAEEEGILMAPGFICSSLSEVKKATRLLSESYEYIAIKHDLSLSGYFSGKFNSKKIKNLKKVLDKISGGSFKEGKDVVVVEGWVKNKGALCAHIEIVEGQDPIICGAWQQLIDKDGISYMGAGPLRLSPKAFKSFMDQVMQFARALKSKGAIGSYGPDFLITSDDEKNLEPDISILIELNARVPYTAYPLEIIKNVKGKIGAGFLATHIKLPSPVKFGDIQEILANNKLLINYKSPNAKGVVPYNTGLLPWGLFDIVVMGDSFEEVLRISEQVKSIFEKFKVN